MLTKFAAALPAITLFAGPSMRQHIVTLSALLIFQPAQRDWLKNNVYAALRTEHAGMGFVVGAILPRLWCVHEVGVTEGY